MQKTSARSFYLAISTMASFHKPNTLTTDKPCSFDNRLSDDVTNAQSKVMLMFILCFEFFFSVVVGVSFHCFAGLFANGCSTSRVQRDWIFWDENGT